MMERHVTIDEIQRRVAEHFNIRLAEMTSDRQEIAVARPRQVAMYLAKRLTPRSLRVIGRKFCRDRTTVMHAVRKIEELKTTDPALAEDVELLRSRLQGCAGPGLIPFHNHRTMLEVLNTESLITQCQEIGLSADDRRILSELLRRRLENNPLQGD